MQRSDPQPTACDNSLTARFIGMRSPVHLAWCSEIRAIPFKKTAKTAIGCLEKAEMDALLGQPDRRTGLGVRDHALLLFLYNSGARADEAAKLTVGNLQLGASPSVRLHGKGNKVRICPLWPTTATSLTRLVTDRDQSDAVFLGRTKEPLTRFGIHRVVTQYAALASKTVPTLATKRVSPHTIRHTTAVHLLRAGVDINTIRAWLGHVSLDTTNIYAEVDLEMKDKALAKVDISGLRESPRQRSLPSLVAFLKPCRLQPSPFMLRAGPGKPPPSLARLQQPQHKFGRNITTIAVTVGMRPTSSTARSAQFGSVRRRVPCLTPLRLKSLCSSASSVSSPGKSQLNPTAAARCKLSCTVLRYPQYDRNLAGARPASGKPKHLSQLSHGQPSRCRHQNVPVHGEVIVAKVADPGGNLQLPKTGRSLIGMAAGFTSKSAIRLAGVVLA
ncbi:tyrosine-type recombinase/integrase [Mesorhizobium sp. L-2-11]|uniref:tyrosine-type recombinase/integrase n=1 Tax=Mesorhizobium sp. L-2-11 TaxID=2744521 RepID=UPI00313C22D9